MKRSLIFLCALTLAAGGDAALGAGDAGVSGPYLGHEPPGLMPELFAPGIVSVDAHFEHSAAVFSPDGDYMLINQSPDRREDELYVSFREVDGSWTDRVKTPYSCGGFLALSPDGKYLFFLGDGIYWVSTSFVEKLRPQR